MPRPRTGTLLAPGADGFWRARVTRPDGTRPLYSLGTADKSLARRKLARLVEAINAGRDPLDAADVAGAPEHVNEYTEAWLTAREGRGVAKARWERSYFKNHVVDVIGHMPLGDVRPAHIRVLLEEVAAKGLKRATVGEVRGLLFRVFDHAWRAEIIESNPVARVKLPEMREVRKERCILTDDEFGQLIACAEVDLELRMMALVARCEGGMRTGDLHKWDWSMLDRVHFAECFIPRAKRLKPQRLAIPGVLAPFLRAWHAREGDPESGPVFPVRTGKRAGEAKKTNSHAKRLRAALLRAGVFRLPPVEVADVGKGRRTDLGRHSAGKKLAPHPADALYFETEVSLPVDFHSFRRAFNTALAEAGVNVQRAMHLADHSDPRVHARYVMHTAAMREIPAEALPTLPAALKEPPGRDESRATAGARAARIVKTAAAEPRSGAGIVTARDDSAGEGEGSTENPKDFSRRDRFRTYDPYRVNGRPGRFGAFPRVTEVRSNAYLTLPGRSPPLRSVRPIRPKVVRQVVRRAFEPGCAPPGGADLTYLSEIAAIGVKNRVPIPRCAEALPGAT